MPPLITLTTDFGLADEYVGVMKGVIATICPEARIIDLCHGITPQDIRQAALVLASSFRFFPAGSVHVVVVDPGVGTGRRIIVLDCVDHLFLAPDNGVVSLLIPAARRAHAVTAEEYFSKPVSATFHGRDIFAPVAARLACGTLPDRLGPPLAPADLCTLPLPHPTVKDGRLQGAVVHIDRFGNLITDIDRHAFSRFCNDRPDRVRITLNSWTIDGIRTTYGSVPPGEIVALMGSRDYLEIGINQGNAAKKMQIGLDTTVYLSI